MTVLFYAPMKPPDHPTPSGDRRMARLLIAALRKAGREVVLASDFRSYDGQGEPARQAALAEEGRRLAAALSARWREAAVKPSLWFTYHLYHKAPDWLGPAVAEALGIPYVVAEASHAPKRAGGPWEIGYRAAEAAIVRADVVYALTRHDMACLAPLVRAPHRLVHLPPFLDAAALAPAVAERPLLAVRYGLDPDRRWLLAVAMMRSGDKERSFAALAKALARLPGDDWQLLLVGDGPRRPAVEALFAPLGPRVVYAGVLPATDLPALYAGADLYVWPGAGEAYGMAYLEAQAQGLPVVAGHERGVPDVVCDGTSGRLVSPGDAAAFAGAVRHLLDHPGERAAMAAAARRFVAAERGPAAAARLLAETLP